MGVNHSTRATDFSDSSKILIAINITLTKAADYD